MLAQTESSNRGECLKGKHTHGEHKERVRYRGKLKQTKQHRVFLLFVLLQARKKVSHKSY